MAKKIFNYSEADYIKVQFRCSCGEIITSELLPIKDKFDIGKDYNCIDYKIECKCGFIHKIKFSDDLYSSICEIESIDDNSFIYLHEIPYEYAKKCDNSLLDYIQKIVVLKEIVEKIDDQSNLDKEYLKEMAFVYAISILDAYAKNLFVYLLSTFSEFFDNFMHYSNKYKKKEKKDVLDSLRYYSFQDYNRTIIPFFNNAFIIELSENRILGNAVEIRNCIMHHNGRDSDGYMYTITMRDIIDLIEQVQAVVNTIGDKTDNAVFELLWSKGTFDNIQ